MTSRVSPHSTTSPKVLVNEGGTGGRQGERRHIKTQMHMQARRHVARTNVRGQRPTTPLFKPGSSESSYFFAAGTAWQGIDQAKEAAGRGGQSSRAATSPCA
jgi:hypothetical protein